MQAVRLMQIAELLAEEIKEGNYILTAQSLFLRIEINLKM